MTCSCGHQPEQHDGPCAECRCPAVSTSTDPVLTHINGRWPLYLPPHRAYRKETPWWEATRLAAMNTVIGPGSVVWDIGAEEGEFPCLWASWGAEVVMAEPNPAVWANIRYVWEANGFEPLFCWPGFIGASVDPPNLRQRVPSLLEFNDGSFVTGWPTWPECAAGPVIHDHGFCQLGERPDLPTETIDDLMSIGVPGPTVLTMDVEGSEMHVIQGAVDTLRTYKPEVFVSIHPEFMLHHYGIDDGVNVVRQTMRAIGYQREQFLAIDHEHHWWFRP